MILNYEANTGKTANHRILVITFNAEMEIPSDDCWVILYGNQKYICKAKRAGCAPIPTIFTEFQACHAFNSYHLTDFFEQGAL